MTTPAATATGNTDDTVTWISEVEIHDGKKDILLDLCRTVWERVTKSEPGTLVYEFYVEEEENNDNKTTMWVYHRFTNSEAAMKHLKDAVEFPQMAEHMDFKCMRVLGSVDDQMAEILQKFNPIKFIYAGGIKPTLPNRSL